MDKFFENFFDNILPTVIITAVILVAGYWLSRLILRILKNILNKSKVDFTVISFITSVTKVVLYFIVVIAALAQLGVNVTSIITTLGAALVTAGLAMQDSLSNIASGIVIIINKPFKAGDVIEFENLKGTVQDIRIFYTTLLSYDHKVITIPNSRLTDNNVVNCTSAEERRLNLSYTVSYEDDITRVKGVLYTFLSTVDNILEDPAPAVYVGEHKSSGVEILVHVWVKEENYWSVYYEMQEKIKELFDINNITIPYEQVVVRKAD